MIRTKKFTRRLSQAADKRHLRRSASKRGGPFRRRRTLERLESRHLLAAVPPGQFVDDFTMDTEFLDTSAPYVFAADLRINPGVTLQVGPGVTVQLANSVNVDVSGNLHVNNASQVGFFNDNGFSSVSTTSIDIAASGEMQAIDTSITLLSVGNDESIINVEAGGRLISTRSNIAITDVSWASGSLLDPADVTASTFATTISLPAGYIPRLEQNDSFRLVQIIGTPVSSDLIIQQMGTVTTADLVYRFTHDLRIDSDITMRFAPGTEVQIDNQVNIEIAGNLVFDDTAQVGFFNNNSFGNVSITSIDIAAGGELQVISTQITLLTNGNDTSIINVEAGGRFRSNNSAILITDVSWESGAFLVPTDLTNNVMEATLTLPAEYIPRLEQNDQFQLVQIIGTPVSSDLTLRQMGTVTTADLIYRFIRDLRIDSDATMRFERGTEVQINNQVNLEVAGNLVFDEAADVGFFNDNNSSFASITSIDVNVVSAIRATEMPSAPRL